MKLYISSKDEKNNLLAHLQKALDRKAWVTKEEEKHPTTKVSHGIQGIIRTVEREHIAAESTLKGAFSDLQSLMTHAETVAGMAEKFVAVKERMEKQQAASSLSGNNSANNNNSSRDAAVVQQSRQEDEEMDAILHGLGIKSPVTKQFAGAAYHTQLAGQLADFLQIPLQRAGGMMTLTDVYCIFCRARGTEMISPEDLLRAADLFPQQRIPFRLRKFTHSGVLVIQDESYSDAAICKTIVGLLESKGPMTSAEVAAAARISLLLAKQHLNTAETSCLICRDESFEGLKYFPNLFRRRLQ